MARHNARCSGVSEASAGSVLVVTLTTEESIPAIIFSVKGWKT